MMVDDDDDLPELGRYDVLRRRDLRPIAELVQAQEILIGGGAMLRT
jgi:hypothetical protein